MSRFFELYLHASHQQQKLLLMSLNDEQLKLLTEIIYNTAMENIPIPSEDKKKLSKYKTGIRKVLVEGISRTNRRRRLLYISNIIPVFIHNYLQWLEK